MSQLEAGEWWWQLKQAIDNLTVVNGAIIPLDDEQMGEAQALRDILATTSGPIIAKALDTLSDNPGLLDYYIAEWFAQTLNLCDDKWINAMEAEQLVYRHLAVCLHNLLAIHGNEESKKLFRDELGYGQTNYSIDQLCEMGLKTLAEAGNKNAQTGKPDYFEPPSLSKKGSEPHADQS